MLGAKKKRKDTNQKKRAPVFFCGLCSCPLRVKCENFEKVNYISRESQTIKQAAGTVHLLDLWQSSAAKQIVTSVSARIRKACPRKIRNSQALIKRIPSGINQPSTSCTVYENICCYKHQLPTTIDLTDRSAQARKS